MRLPYILFSLVIFLAACSQEQSDAEAFAKITPEDEHAEMVGLPAEIHLTPEQIDAVGIGYGQLASIPASEYIEATGTLDVPPGSESIISAPTSGFLRRAGEYVDGDYVRRGTLLAELENPDFIDLQQNYLEIKAELDFLQLERQRQEELVSQQAGVKRELERVTSQIRMKQASLAGLKERLAFLGIAVDDLTPERIVRRISIRASRSGYLASIEMRDGMFVESNQQLADIIDDEHFHLELAVFEADVARLRKGQKITYTIPALGDEIYEAEVHVIGKEFNRDNKTLRVHGHLEDPQPPFVRDLFAEARIWLDTATVSALPAAAVVTEGGRNYIFVTQDSDDAGELHFNPVEVVAGEETQGMVSVRLLRALTPQERIVTRQAYYIQAQGKVGELEHEH